MSSSIIEKTSSWEIGVPSISWCPGRHPDPGVFHLREEDGQSYVLSEEVSPQDEANVRLAARGCPEQAITVS